MSLNELEHSQGVVRVLIVDDNRDTVLTLGILLRSEGYIVRLATDATEALTLLEEWKPDAALLDLHMPDRSGFALANDLRRRYAGKCPILIAVTAHADPEHRGLAETSGFDHFVAKPYEPEALLELIDGLKPRSWDASPSTDPTA
jgi:CheY-like chemotaxis protein